MQNAGPFVAIDGAQLRPAQGQLAVGPDFGFVDADMKRAVHGLHKIGLVIDIHRRVHIFLIETQVSAGFPKVTPTHVRCVKQVIPRRKMPPPPLCFNQIAYAGTLRMPQDKPRTHFILDAKQIQFLAQDAVVAFFGFFHAIQIRV